MDRYVDEDESQNKFDNFQKLKKLNPILSPKSIAGNIGVALTSSLSVQKQKPKIKLNKDTNAEDIFKSEL